MIEQHCVGEGVDDFVRGIAAVLVTLTHAILL